MKFPIHFGLEKAGLPLVITTGTPENLIFLIDTGSTHDVIFDFVYQHFKDFFTRIEDGNSVMGIDGFFKSTKAANVELQFDDLKYKSSFLILEANDAISNVQAETGIQIHGILGIPFLINNKCNIDFKNLIIQSNC